MSMRGSRFLGAACLLISLAAAPASAGSKARAALGDPRAWFGSDNYPAAALRANEQGRVVAEVQIDDTGKLVSCKVTGSSGSVSLDQTTCELALQDRYYKPAIDRKGQPISSKTTLAVRWVLPNGGFGDPADVTNGPPLQRSMAMTMTVSGDGLLEGCHADVIGRKLGDNTDPCDRMKVGSKVSAGFLRDGHPVGGKIIVRSSQEVLIDP